MNTEIRFMAKLAARAFVAALITTGIAYCHVHKQPDVYRATTLLLLNRAPAQRPEYASPQAAAMHFEKPDPPEFVKSSSHPMAMPDYAAILLSDEVMEQLRPVMAGLQEQYQPGSAPPSRGRVRAALEARPRVLLQTPYDIYYQHTLELHATTGHPELSAALANAWADTGLAVIERLRTDASAEEASEPAFNVASRAYPPESSSGPNRSITLLSALLLGLIIGTGHFFFMRALRIYAPMMMGDA